LTLRFHTPHCGTNRTFCQMSFVTIRSMHNPMLTALPIRDAKISPVADLPIRFFPNSFNRRFENMLLC